MWHCGQGGGEVVLANGEELISACLAAESAPGDTASKESKFMVWFSAPLESYYFPFLKAMNAICINHPL